MNSSKTNEILKDIKSDTSNITVYETATGATSSDTLRVISALDDTNWATNNNTLSNISTSVLSIQGDASQTTSYLDDIDTNIETINNKLVDIGISLSRDATKIWFHERLYYNENDYLFWDDYSSSPILGQYRNTLDKPIYITQFNFIYEESSEPDVSAETYHSPKFECKLGKIDSNDNFVAPYMVIEDNKDQAHNMNKYTGFNPIAYCWQYPFHDFPVELGVSGRFGHYIQGNMTSTYYDSFMYAHVKGYYYE